MSIERPDLYTEKIVTRRAGMKLNVRGHRYTLKQDIKLEVYNWQGAYAMLLISDPANPDNLISFGVASDKRDITLAVRKVMKTTARRYDSLRHKEKLERSEPEELSKLGELLEAA